MFLTGKHLSRRTVLKGLAVAIPLLLVVAIERWPNVVNEAIGALRIRVGLDLKMLTTTWAPLWVKSPPTRMSPSLWQAMAFGAMRKLKRVGKPLPGSNASAGRSTGGTMP